MNKTMNTKVAPQSGQSPPKKVDTPSWKQKSSSLTTTKGDDAKKAIKSLTGGKISMSESASDKVAAAIKLQALFRGNQGRKRAILRVEELINNAMNNIRNKTMNTKVAPQSGPSPPKKVDAPSWKQKSSLTTTTKGDDAKKDGAASKKPETKGELELLMMERRKKQEAEAAPKAKASITAPSKAPSPGTAAKAVDAKKDGADSKKTESKGELELLMMERRKKQEAEAAPKAKASTTAPSKAPSPGTAAKAVDAMKDDAKKVDAKKIETKQETTQETKPKRKWWGGKKNDSTAPAVESKKNDVVESKSSDANNGTKALKTAVKPKEVSKNETKEAPPVPPPNGKHVRIVSKPSEVNVAKEDIKTETRSTSASSFTKAAPVKAAAKTEAKATSSSASKPEPPLVKPKAASAPKTKSTGGGTRVWIKQSAVDAIRKPKGFKPGVGLKNPKQLLKKASNDSIRSNDNDSEKDSSSTPVIKRSTKWLWKQGSLVDSSGKTITVSLDDDDGEPLVMPATAMTKGDVVVANDYRLSKNGTPICPDDLISLTHLHEPSVVECLEHRYNEERIYTSTGQILLALNPFKRIAGLYEDENMKKYWRMAEIEQETGEPLPPHIYAIADNAFLTMMRQLEDALGRPSEEGHMGCDQSILVSGESGAGKTVTTKFAMKYLAALSQRKTVNLNPNQEDETEHSMDDSGKRPSSLRRMSSHLNVASQHSVGGQQESIEEQVLQSNPILESFGNARTIRNDNSSRFGKFIEMQFTRRGKLVGASIEVYLLEKVRLVKASPGERNYHVFYELLEGDMPKSERAQYFLDAMATPEDFKLTATGTYTRRDGVTDDETYDDLMLAMNSMGFPKEEQTNIFTTVAAILHASNLTFLDLDGKSKLDFNNKHLQPACKLFGVTPEDLSEALCHVTLNAGNKTTMKKDLTVDKAIKGLEALFKTTYGTLFTYLVTRVNEKVAYKKEQCEESGNVIHNPKRDAAASIGVLDIFGFESFQVNSFEQLCINYCNEALQQQFNTFVIENEQAEYEREGINWSFIKFPENQDVLDLIGKKGTGLISILDDQCKTPGTTDKSFATNLYSQCKKHVRFSADRRQSAQLKFSIHHYAGAVEYTADGFVEKNRDELPKEATELLKNSSNPFIRLLAGIIESSAVKAAAKKATNNKAKNTKETVGSEFHRQLRHLREKIDKTTPHYVRCLKPNDQLVQNCFDKAAIVEQVRCGGVIEAVRVARAGFSNQFSHPDFYRRYSTCVWKELKKRKIKPRRGRGAVLNKGKGKKGPRKISSRECEDLMKLLYKKLTEKDDDEEEKSDGEDGEDKKEEEEKETNVFKLKAKKASEDTSSELLKVGLQFGKTKVFVRHAAFENLERIRTQEQAKAAVKLNSCFRMALIRKEYSDRFQNAARQARIAAILAENPDWEDPTFNKETMDRYDKNREAFSGGGKKFVKEQNKVGKLKLPGIFGN